MMLSIEICDFGNPVHVYISVFCVQIGVNVLFESMSGKYTPDVAQLLPERQYRCEHCNDVFGNQSHYQLHLRRRHKLIATSSRTDVSSYHCPVDNCVYHVDRQGGRGFANLRFLRQHYQKTHMAKEYTCSECNERFLLERHLEKHKCCSVYPCLECGLTYTSKASLQTHMRRKNHLDSTVPPASTKVPLASLRTWKKLQENSENTVDMMSQPIPDSGESDQSMARAMHTIYYCLPITEIPYAMQMPPQTENVVALQADIDTQEKMEQDLVSHDNELPIPSFTDEEVERLLHDMETQTDDVDLDTLDMNNEVLVPLLRNIQTQTLDNRQNQSTMTELDLKTVANATNDFVAYQEQPEPMFGLQTSSHMHTQTCDELFEELGLSHIQTQTHCPDGLYNTQHTQTCDEMLDEFLENFQSTCTQTRWLDWQETDDPSN